ncbi:CAP domain-containing protein [Cytobacillus sp. Hz8]|uniref:CAP domain-containing protein n=1 Tax=Cytobacillus sp. Hz8 TaxID=3347168 RepID=UPI0035E14112
MVKGKISLLIASSTLVLGLSACNTNRAMDVDDRRANILDTDDDNRIINDVNDRDLRIRNFDNDVDNDLDVDRNGPLTEEYDVNNNDNDFDISGKRYHRNKMLNISDANTSLSSNNYPHTRPVLIQEAKYKFVRVNPKDLGNIGLQQIEPNQRQTAQAPKTAPKPNQQGTTNKNNITATSKTVSQAAQQVINLTNAERRKNGLPDLKLDTQLNGVAQRKSDDMQQNNYFSHTSPTYGSPFDMMRDFGVTYKSAGENIAQGQRTSQEVVNSWMKSEGHRKNILNRNFTHIGVGFDQAGYHWTQMFVGK